MRAYEGMPKVAVKGDGRRMIFYEVSQPSPHSRWGVSDIHFVVSAERGGSWSEPRSVMPDKPENSRSEERRVGKEWRDRWGRGDEEEKSTVRGGDLGQRADGDAKRVETL